jgi:hypothetical protein
MPTELLERPTILATVQPPGRPVEEEEPTEEEEEQ